MGTIDISYYNLFIGLLLLAIPFFYLWKFKTGLLKPAVIGTLRMIIQLFFIGVLGEYILSINEKVNRKPRVVVKKMINMEKKGEQE